MCSLVTGSDALRKEANRTDQILVDNGIIMDENEDTLAQNHWLRIYGVDSHQKLVSNREFLMNCNYNACVYEGNDTETCIQDKVDSCLEIGFSYNECFPK